MFLELRLQIPPRYLNRMLRKTRFDAPGDDIHANSILLSNGASVVDPALRWLGNLSAALADCASESAAPPSGVIRGFKPLL